MILQNSILPLAEETFVSISWHEMGKALLCNQIGRRVLTSLLFGTSVTRERL